MLSVGQFSAVALVTGALASGPTLSKVGVDYEDIADRVSAGVQSTTVSTERHDSLTTLEARISAMPFDSTQWQHRLRKQRAEEHLKEAEYYASYRWDKRRDEHVRLANAILSHHASRLILVDSI